MWENKDLDKHLTEMDRKRARIYWNQLLMEEHDNFSAELINDSKEVTGKQSNLKF
jgi:hypothetical protein